MSSYPPLKDGPVEGYHSGMENRKQPQTNSGLNDGGDPVLWRAGPTARMRHPTQGALVHGM